ncbi:MAG: hypothetical protein JO261_02140 [Alphaproteobacteria bacterium]|nr:hypothetical protein [Alphaproteobacteria bacterium]MBV9692479.1 hypothetical protein [Alphaproteobacteria bacterium]
MDTYRVYWLDEDGRITKGEYAQFRDDEEAQDVARRLAGNGYTIEIWQADRRVLRLDSHGSAPLVY